MKLCEGCGAFFPSVVSDGMGGAYVAFGDRRDNDSTEADIYAQRVTSEGSIAPGWPASGRPLCTERETQRLTDLIADGEGNFYANWYDFRSPPVGAGTGVDIYASRIGPDGEYLPGWVASGNPVTRNLERQIPGGRPNIALDGTGGAYFIWEDSRNYPTNLYDVYAQHLLGDASVAAGWDSGGNPVCAMPGFQFDQLAVPDGSGGVYFAWDDFRGGSQHAVIGGALVSRFTPDGQLAKGWTPNGNQFGPVYSRLVALVPDLTGGAYVVRGLPDFSSPGNDSAYVVNRITASGGPAPGWPADGITVCDAFGVRNVLRATGDGLGGLILTWTDLGRFPGQPGGGYEVYVARLQSDGTRPPGWPDDGIRVSDPTLSFSFEGESQLAPDGSGGLFVAWERDTSCCTYGMIQHIDAAGQVAMGWQPNGHRLSTFGTSVKPRLTYDGQGGVIVVWDDLARLGIYAQRYVADGPVPVAVSLVRQQVTRDRVQLAWLAPDLERVTIERREGEAPWRVLGELLPDGRGEFVYTDETVEAEREYAYRLAYGSPGQERRTSEVVVRIPSGARFALGGAQPNPAPRGALRVAFALPSAAPAKLELFDLAGRVVARRDVGVLGPGEHVLALDAPAASPGVHWLRLTQGGDIARSRVVIVE